MKVQIDRVSDLPLYIQIRNQIRDAILRGDIAEGEKLLPERQLAGQLGVNRTTVVNAYRELAADGLVEGHVGSGTRVSWVSPTEADSGARPMAWSQYFVRQTEWPGQALAQEAADLAAQPGVVSLAGGVPAPELYPTDAFCQACDSFLRSEGTDLLAHCPAEGFYPLRQWLAEWARSRGIDGTPENVLITSGATQSLDLLRRLLVEPDDKVVVETPTSLAALQGFNAARARLIGVPLDVQGMQVDRLKDVLSQHRPKLVYTLPTFQNPSGMTLAPARREQLVRLVEQQGIPLVEDDPYSALSFEDPSPVPLKALDRHGYVIYVSTFSKLLFPGLRLGWLIGPRPVIESLAQIRRNVDLFSNTLAQGSLWHFLQAFDWPGYLERLRGAYRQRRDAMIEALRRYGPPDLRWETPAGGFYLWVQLPSGILARNLLAEAHQTGVSFLPGEPFCVDGGGRNTIRLNYSYASTEDIEEGIRRLSQAIRRLMERKQDWSTVPATTRTIV